ncbi:hypothetical protein SLA2020_012650 [Shorea laevis]
MQEAVIDSMNTFGRIAVSGVISVYTDEKKRAAPNMVDGIYKRITIQGFLVIDYMDLFPDFVFKTCKYLSTGEIQPLEDISDGVKSIPWLSLIPW